MDHVTVPTTRDLALNMRVLFVARTLNPANPLPSPHAEYYFYSAMVNNGLDVHLVGPIYKRGNFLEGLIKKLYCWFSQKRYLKYHLSTVWRASREVTRAVEELHPHVVFSAILPPLVFYAGSVPCIMRVDSLTLTNERQFPTLGRLALKGTVWQEKQALGRCARIITHSEWARDGIIHDYGIPPERIVTFPLPAPLPPSVVPNEVDFQMREGNGYLRLLFVGQDPARKGLDIALQVVEGLNARGFPARLVVCGISQRGMPESTHVDYAGFYNKSNEQELTRYVALYRSAHFLLHPARFEPYGQVTSEAAAFGLPVITNDVGGLSSAVTSESGIVLPPHAPPELYIQTIINLMANPDEYRRLCYMAHERYKRELNWDVCGKRLAEVIREVVAESGSGAAPSPREHSGEFIR